MTQSTRPPGADSGGFDDVEDHEVEEARTVRPYMVTRGRTRTVKHDLALETLVRLVAGASASGSIGHSPERTKIIEMVTDRILSVAELSAYLRLPLGVTKVLIGDLVDDGTVAVHGGADASLASAANLKVLESVLNGISSL